MEMTFSGSTVKRNEVKNAGQRIESALDATDCQAASMCLRQTHDESQCAKTFVRGRNRREEKIIRGPGWDRSVGCDLA